MYFTCYCKYNSNMVCCELNWRCLLSYRVPFNHYCRLISSPDCSRSWLWATLAVSQRTSWLISCILHVDTCAQLYRFSSCNLECIWHSRPKLVLSGRARSAISCMAYCPALSQSPISHVSTGTYDDEKGCIYIRCKCYQCTKKTTKIHLSVFWLQYDTVSMISRVPV